MDTPFLDAAGVQTDAAQETPPAVATPVIDWESDDNPLKSVLAQREQELQRVQADLGQLTQVSQAVLTQVEQEKQQRRNVELQRQYEDGELTWPQVQAVIQGERQQMKQQAEQFARPFLAQEWAVKIGSEQGLTKEEVEELKQSPPEAMPWAAQRMLAERKTRSTFEERIAQLERSMGAQQVASSGVSSASPAGGAAQAPGDGTPLSLLRSALSEMGYADMVGRRRDE